MALKIGISGKRIINNNEKEKVAREIESRIRQLLPKHNTGNFVGCTAVAIGADTIFAEVVRNVFKMPLHVTLPLPLDVYKKDFTTSEDLAKLTSLVETASTVEIVRDIIPANHDEKTEAYLEAGKYIVDICDEMIFVWDELKPSGKGGTAEIIGYYSHCKEQVPVDYIPVTPEKGDPIHAEIIKEYEQANKLAMKSRDGHKLSWRLSIVLGWLAVVLFTTNVAFHLKDPTALVMVWLELLLVAGAFILIMTANSRKYHSKYLSHRIKAEKLRVLKHFYDANVKAKVSDFTLSNDSHLSAIVQRTNQAIHNNSYHSGWYANYSIKSLIEDQKQYHQRKIRSIGGKYHFFEQLNQFIALLFMLNLLMHVTDSTLAYYTGYLPFYDHNEIVFGTVQPYGRFLQFYNHTIIVFMSILLPATYAAIEGIIYFQEWKLLKKYSSSAKQSLHESLNELPAMLKNVIPANCFDKQCTTLHLVSSIMLTDNRNWHLILENKDNYHLVV